MKILVVDDSPTMRRVIKSALQKINFTDLVEAVDGQDALDKLSSEKIEFVITDWNMPNMNGLELVKSIRNHPKFSTLPILMVTTRGNKADVVEAVKAKINNYVVKPFTPDVLNEKIQAVLSALRRQ